MPRTTQEIISDVAYTLARRDPEATKYRVSRDTLLLVKGSESLHKLAENECNFGLSPRQEARQRNLVAKLKSIAATYDLHIEAPIDCRSGSGAKLTDTDFMYIYL